MKKAIPFILLVVTMLLWASNFHLAKIALAYQPPLSMAAVRFFFAVVTLVVLLYLKFGNKLLTFRFTKKELGYLFLTSFLGIFLSIYFFNVGLQTTSAINGSLIVATSPAITAILAFFLQKKEIRLLQWIAIAISFIGVLVILVKGDFNRLTQFKFEEGDIYFLMMAMTFSLSQIVVSKYLTHMDATLMTFMGLLIALVLFSLFSIPEFLSEDMPTNLPYWGSILCMGILGTGVAYTAFYYCVMKVGATTSTLFMNLVPFFAVLLAFPFGEAIYAVQIGGGLLVICGLLLFRVGNSAAK